MLSRYIIIENMESKELSVISRDEYTYEMHFTHEPVTGCNNATQANELCEHIKQIGVREYLSQIFRNFVSDGKSKGYEVRYGKAGLYVQY